MGIEGVLCNDEVEILIFFFFFKSTSVREYNEAEVVTIAEASKISQILFEGVLL